MMCYCALPISTLWQTSLSNQPSSAVLSLLQPVLSASTFNLSFFLGSLSRATSMYVPQ